MKEYTFREYINKNGESIGCMEYTIPDNAVRQIRADAFDDFADNIKKYYASKKKKWDM